ncbi:MAG: SIS domain-containing protein [Bacteroidota bacterium]|jgi:arabinose-5-phosphate isomerase|nr:KpsF/GutQ family sugar-phosphate isomerase [Chitinophagaceae bacterium]GDX43450.1 D-arabinose 5-phosphate isomerase [Bacteroidota bacterium]
MEIARRTLELEAQAVSDLAASIQPSFEETIHVLNDMKGRLVISGIGKSAIVGQKIVATLNSTGTPSIFMHAADAIHGDLGMIQHDDVVMIISKSGESPEIKMLITLIKNLGNTLIGMVGNMSSILAASSNYILNTTVSQEACPNNLAPTASTTAQMAMGDAVAVSLMELKGFTADDFAKFHPGGTLGKKLYLRVQDLSKLNEKPAVGPDSNIRQVIVEMTKKRLGLTAVTDDAAKLVGVITDGDLRRMLEKDIDIEHKKAKDIMSRQPKTIAPDALAVDALDRMRKNNITQLIVKTGEEYTGVIHLHDLIKEGLV